MQEEYMLQYWFLWKSAIVICRRYIYDLPVSSRCGTLLVRCNERGEIMLKKIYIQHKYS